MEQLDMLEEHYESYDKWWNPPWAKNGYHYYGIKSNTRYYLFAVYITED